MYICIKILIEGQYLVLIFLYSAEVFAISTSIKKLYVCPSNTE